MGSALERRTRVRLGKAPILIEEMKLAENQR